MRLRAAAWSGLLDQRPVRGGVEQRVDLGRVGHLDHEDPAGAVRIGVDLLGRVVERLFTSTIVPVTGEKISDTDLVDSTSAQLAWAITLAPTPGSST